MKEVIAVVGLGYIGLPIACAFDRAGRRVIGYDIEKKRIDELKNKTDRTGECDVSSVKIEFTTDPSRIKEAHFIILTIPTPIDAANQPDLTQLKSASRTVGENMSKGSTVVIESTVYPGVTEDICVPIMEKASGLAAGADFKFGYCPERINPGDQEHTLDRVVKVVSGMDEQTVEKAASTYSEICKGGIWKAPNVKTAEAAKVIENVQRDLNIALMNELSIIFDKIGIRTKEVLDAAATKWNFHRYSPGLVGGHCIGVDPYYLTHLAETIGYHPELILAGRRINDSMAGYVADQVLLGLVKTGKVVNRSKVLVLGVTFKENIPDIRNSKVFQVIEELKKFEVEVSACDPFVENGVLESKFHAIAVPWPLDGRKYDAIVAAVPHRRFREALSSAILEKHLAAPGTILDLKWMFNRSDFSRDVLYMAL